ncbi:hypothetical protein JHJ32_12075 [Parapedobacter sp. ISTM3]|uniref:hypothetical protein n=1 Tax=Parapedobacter sp. ISTM3 TaxID=2800130 RepID=UPI001905CF07|nr:hypothetical protein [Parapedobacter sp. ISTM3]MBK1440728.1 hypothetical protein [Parapedobacter sp. ISTM3]
MAQQESIIKLKGRIGDLTFYETKDGYQARQVKGVSPQRIATDPNYQRTRENNAEFATGAAAAKRLRDTLRPMILLTYDPKMPARLFSRVMRVVKADSVSDRGERQVLPGNLGLLSQFGFNVGASLASTLFVVPECTVDREAGSVTLNIPSLVPSLTIGAPKGATHFQFNFGAAVIDFDTEGEGNGSAIAMAESGTGLLTAETFAPTTLTAAIPAASELPLFVLFGISFYQEVNGKLYPLNNGAYNPVDIIRIDVV